MKLLKIVEPQRASIEVVPKLVPAPYNVLNKIMVSGICGTDIRIFRDVHLGDYPDNMGLNIYINNN
jgi:threonine dehydrogenase-like Zn-dependent dehydrogenase